MHPGGGRDHDVASDLHVVPHQVLDLLHQLRLLLVDLVRNSVEDQIVFLVHFEVVHFLLNPVKFSHHPPQLVVNILCRNKVMLSQYE